MHIPSPTHLALTAFAALAVCSAASVSAQSSAQLYGRVNMAVEYQKQGAHSARGLQSNGSFVGLRAQEDVGAGWKAGVVLEADINADTGAGSDATWSVDSDFSFQRRSELYLASSMGMLRLGAFKRASYEATAQAIEWYSDAMGAASDGFAHNASPRGNVLAVRSATLGGWMGELQYRFGEKQVLDGATLEQRGEVDAALRYAQGPWGLGLGYNLRRNQDTFWGDTDRAQTYSVRASYDAGVWALGAYYQQAKDRSEWVNYGHSGYHSKVWRLAGKYVLGASELHASVGRRTGHRQYVDPTGAARYGLNATEWLVGYHYHLSRRSQLYVQYGHQDNLSMHSLPALWTGSDEHFRVLSIGLRHQF